MTRQEEIVLNFIAAYRESWPVDLAAALQPLAEDAYYQIVVPTIAPVVGRDKILAEHLLMKQKATEQRHDMKSWGSNGNTVFTERVDWSRRNGKWSAVPLVAVFDLNDAGQIIAWREYLDLINISRSHGMTADALIESLDLDAHAGPGA
ncbi:limonene-1,2-epoxide hydrolase family protein [Novosphingobium lentum]|uniref:limonene-1,2-epoxide hydrolase family protein n=1 Tax=Novosphingobium lentum TaxID=145287 RepID=UPI0014701327|nr:limonene-1,2-epoxide hydrolase family protein [Novosphingobium lentum]